MLDSGISIPIAIIDRICYCVAAIAFGTYVFWALLKHPRRWR